MAAPLLLIYTVLLLVRPQDWWGPLFGMPLINYTVIATGLLSLPLLMGNFPRLWNEVPTVKAMFFFLIGAVLSGLRGLRLEGLQLAFEDVGRLFIIYAMLLILGRDRKVFDVLLWVFLLSILWMAAHAIMQHHTGVGFGGKQPMWRVRDPETGAGVYQAIGFGTFDDPNDLCLMLVIPIPIFYALFRAGQNPIVKGMGVLGAAIAAYGAWTTNSRGGVVAAFAMAATYAVTRLKGFRRYVVAAVSISLITVVAPSRFGGKFGFSSGRSILWGDGIAMFKNWPLYGCGYSRFMQHSSEWQVAHNSYIHVLGELGLIGYVPFFLLVYFTVLYLSRLKQNRHLLGRSDQFMLAGMQSAFIGFLTGVYFLSRQYEQLFYLVFALMLLYVLILCDRYKLHGLVLGTPREDTRRGLWWCFASIPFLWITVRLANMAYFG